MPLTIHFKNCSHTDSIVRFVIYYSSQQETRAHSKITIVGYKGAAWHSSDADRDQHLTLCITNNDGLEHVTTIHISRDKYDALRRSKEWRECHQLERIVANIQLDNEAELERRQKLKDLLRSVIRKFKRKFKDLKDEDIKKALKNVYDLELEALRDLYAVLGEDEIDEEAFIHEQGEDLQEEEEGTDGTGDGDDNEDEERVGRAESKKLRLGFWG